MRVPCSLVAVTLLLPALSGCTRGEARPTAAAADKPAAPAVPVTTATAIRKTMPVDVAVIGTAEAHSTVAVRAQVAGQLTSVGFSEGDEVNAGQPLFKLDRRPLEAALEQAEANLERDLAQAANASGQAKRYQELARRGLATPEQVDQNTSAAAALDAATRADRAAIKTAKLQLEYATIAAPIGGRTGALNVHPGNLIQPNDPTALVVINQVSPIYVTFSIPESQFDDVKRYRAQGTLRVEARLPNDAKTPAGGRITFLDNAVDPATGTIKIKGEFVNEDRRFWPGQYVNVTLKMTTIADAIVVPAQAVQTGQKGQYVFVVKADQTVEVRTVRVARTVEAEMVIEQGLAEGERVVTFGQLRLVPGARVNARDGSAPAGS